MERTLFAFIWKHSKRDQILLLGLTLLAFPFLYATLELPKRIVNDAIGTGGSPPTLNGIELSRLDYLALLCGGFLLAVIGYGLMKMWINTRKGILAERLLRRFRYQLIHRILRFPQPYFRRTSQGELVSMVTAEAEPLGGLMGDALAQPVFQAGQMLTILTFLFIQNVWFGLAAVALIPLQAWLIPLLQRRINLLNKARVQEVRGLAEEIGESAAGAGDLRVNGGWRRRQAVISRRLGRLFEIRYRIYRQKFFMKFLNNFISQLTPFFFFAIGGYLAIQGQLSVGALVAALAAYKDLSAPWKELLAYYNQVQDMSLRWQTIVERFMPRGMVEAELFEGAPEDIPHLKGPIAFERVSVRDGDGALILDGVDLEIPQGATVAVASRSAIERRAFAELIARESTPSSGRVRIAGQDVAGLHQAVIAARIGYAGNRPYLFNGTVGDNITMALSTAPRTKADTKTATEAKRTGNSPDPLDAPWLNPGLADLEDEQALREWWLKLTEAMGTDTYLFRRGLDSRFETERHPHLAERVVALRPEIVRRLSESGLGCAVHRFEPERFNPGLPVAGNALYATPSRDIGQEALASDPRFVAALGELKLEDDLLALGKALLSLLGDTFGRSASAHPLFRKLGIDAALFDKLLCLLAKARDKGTAALDPCERALLLTVPFRFSADQLGAPIPEALQARILEVRRTQGAQLRVRTEDVFEPIEPERFATGLTLLENALYGKLALSAGAKAARVRELVAEVLADDGLRAEVAELIYDVPSGISGANLPPYAHERIAFVRAAIKRPDILVLDRALASHDEADRRATAERLRALLPETTLIFLEESFTERHAYDLYVEIEDGRLLDDASVAAAAEGDAVEADVLAKVRALEKTELFSRLERRQLRLLAFGARWIHAEAGEVLFRTGDPADGAYLLVKGEAELRWPGASAQDRPVSLVEPGRVVGDLAVILGERRRLDMVATCPLKGLRIGTEEFRTIAESDIGVAGALLRTVSGYLVEVGTQLRAVRQGEEDAGQTEAGAPMPHAEPPVGASAEPPTKPKPERVG
ncbi:MAG: ABC transporter transmembrane domain-containing protein [Pseudomonadota bacterium]